MATRKHLRMSSGGVLKLSLVLLCVSALLVPMKSASQDLEEKPKSELIEEILELRADRSFLLDTADDLTVRLDGCEELLELTESPPCEDGFPWLVAGVSVLVGAVTYALVTD